MTNSDGLRRLGEAGFRCSLGMVMLGISASATADSEQARSRHLALGLGVAGLPRYQGSDEYEAEPVPLIDARYGRFFARSGEGIGIAAIDTDGFTAGVSANWMRGYQDDDVPRGIDEVDSALGARLFVSTRLWGAVATLATTRAITEVERGLLVNAVLAYPIHATERLMVTPSLGATWANEKYMIGYFGIDATESAASGLAPYQPEGGFKDASLRISASYRMTEKVSAWGAVGVTRLLGEAADSPLVEDDTHAIGLLGFVYRF